MIQIMDHIFVDHLYDRGIIVTLRFAVEEK